MVSPLRWICSLGENHYFEKHSKISTEWIEFRDGELNDTYTQISLDYDENGDPTVFLVRKRDNYEFKLTQAIMFSGANLSESETKDCLGFWDREDCNHDFLDRFRCLFQKNYVSN